MYRVLNWDRHFEGAKSKTYNNKTSCSMPTKHGLGYKRLIREKNGPALFGAWCALIQVISRHPKPRKGYCTDDGTSTGRPYTPEDLEILTDIPAKYFSEMFNVCKSHHVGWVSLTKVKDTDGDCQGTMVPLNLDLDSNLNSDLDSDSLCAEPVPDSTPEDSILIFPCIGDKKEWHLTESKLNEWKDTYEVVDILAECKKARQWIIDNKSKRKTARGMTRFIGGWISSNVNKGTAIMLNEKAGLSDDIKSMIDKIRNNHGGKWGDNIERWIKYRMSKGDEWDFERVTSFINVVGSEMAKSGPDAFELAVTKSIADGNKSMTWRYEQ